MESLFGQKSESDTHTALDSKTEKVTVSDTEEKTDIDSMFEVTTEKNIDIDSIFEFISETETEMNSFFESKTEEESVFESKSEMKETDMDSLFESETEAEEDKDTLETTENNNHPVTEKLSEYDIEEVTAMEIKTEVNMITDIIKEEELEDNYESSSDSETELEIKSDVHKKIINDIQEGETIVHYFYRGVSDLTDHLRPHHCSPSPLCLVLENKNICDGAELSCSTNYTCEGVRCNCVVDTACGASKRGKIISYT